MAEAAKLLEKKKLDKEDLRILMGIEIGMKRSKYVTVNNIKFYSRYPIEETLFRLKKVHKLDLIIRDSSKNDIAYTLNSIGYDVLGLHTLVERKIISQLGPIIGKGKESDVYGCMDDNENIYALKIYRMGRTSFKNIKMLRNFLGDRKHLSWLYVNRLAAKKEFDALSKIYELKLDTPKPIGFNRHMIVMSYLRGKELAYYRNLKNPSKIFNKIIKISSGITFPCQPAKRPVDISKNPVFRIVVRVLVSLLFINIFTQFTDQKRITIGVIVNTHRKSIKIHFNTLVPGITFKHGFYLRGTETHIHIKIGSNIPGTVKFNFVTITKFELK